jgi:DNA mismatch endonuclease (patch repair protein)
MDSITKEHRSWNMSRIKSKDTKPELIVRSFLHKSGFRFRLNGKVSKVVHKKRLLSGKPDIVLPKYKTVIFVNGCFWHGHENCPVFRLPKTKTKWWEEKIGKNKKRDKIISEKLKESGFKQIIVWECELKTKELGSERLETLIKEIVN